MADFAEGSSSVAELPRTPERAVRADPKASPGSSSSPMTTRQALPHAMMMMTMGNDRFIPCRSSSRLAEGLALGSASARDGRDRLLRSELLSQGGAVFSFSPRRERPPVDENVLPNGLAAHSFGGAAAADGSPAKLSAEQQKTARRRIASAPFKILKAPKLADDFYLDLVAWSSTNVLAVGLGPKVFVWSACTSFVQELCDVGGDAAATSAAAAAAVCAVAWTAHGTRLAVGTRTGEVVLYDAARRNAAVGTAACHEARVGCVAWNGNVLAAGSRDRTITLRDARQDLSRATATLRAHRQEVCGLKWSPDGSMLASGGNDNKLLVWDIRKIPETNKSSNSSGSSSSTTTPASPVLLAAFEDHAAAVKAIAWSPHDRGVFASGGGAADRTLRFRDALTGTALEAIDTGSQVCNLVWSRSVDELVSTHGFSLNQICIWRCKPTVQKSATLLGHTTRVLYLATSPDDTTVVTGAGDETLRFWSCFPASPNADCDRPRGSLLFPSASSIR